jgi:hypothetical protein
MTCTIAGNAIEQAILELYMERDEFEFRLGIPAKWTEDYVIFSISPSKMQGQNLV